MVGPRDRAIEGRFASDEVPRITATGERVIEFMIYDEVGKWEASGNCPLAWLHPTAAADSSLRGVFDL